MDKNKIRHDLGVAYAQARMIDALAKNSFPEQNKQEYETGIDAAHKMLEWYSQCIDELIQIKDREITDPDTFI